MNSKENIIYRVAITGPESTGKSTLAQQLANHYNTIWIPEFARNYIENLHRDYAENDLLEIAKGQIESEESSIGDANRLVFFDTELLVIKIWAEHKFGKVHPWILSKFHEISYDLYLLTDIDLSWKFDPQRENPDNGMYFFNWFKRELHEKNVPFDVVSGDEDSRLKNAITKVDKLLDANLFQQ